MRYRSTKTYGHEIGLSACFRQHAATSHCSQLHGYALAVHLEFEADDLNELNWVVDFGSLKPIKAYLQDTFDHKLLVASDDPKLDELCQLAGLGLADVLVVQATGCEAFAQMIYYYVDNWLSHREDNSDGRVRLRHVSVREHGANSASYYGDSYE
jgi:6-pyruvoyltetrahydropterin/6-carboxytetrahydropterin synthase